MKFTRTFKNTLLFLIALRSLPRSKTILIVGLKYTQEETPFVEQYTMLKRQASALKPVTIQGRTYLVPDL